MKITKFKILHFINSNSNWREILSSAPYNLMFRDDGKYTLIKYNQIFSDFQQKMVREARGFIIKKVGRKYKFVCVPFTKFFCVGDPNAKKDIQRLYKRKEWHITEKIDGSLIKLWWDDGVWRLSTSGTLDAYDAPLQFPIENINTYGDLFEYASRNKIDYRKLDKGYTYMFELVGLENKVIVPYETEDVYYLGRRNNYTLQETPYEDDKCVGLEGCKRPKHEVVYIKSAPKKILKEIINRTNALSRDNEHFEGFVVSDRGLKTRVKIKSLEYLDLFAKKGNGIFNARKILLMILHNQDDDVVSAFPEYKTQFDIIRRKLSIWITKVKKDLEYMLDNTWETKKEFAEWAKQSSCSTIMFAAYGKDPWAEGWLENKVNSIHIDTLLGYIEEER